MTWTATSLEPDRKCENTRLDRRMTPTDPEPAQDAETEMYLGQYLKQFVTANIIAYIVPEDPLHTTQCLHYVHHPPLIYQSVAYIHMELVSLPRESTLLFLLG